MHWTGGESHGGFAPPVAGVKRIMPEKETIRRARKDAEEGKAPSTQAGEFVREEIEHVREGKHGVRSPKQAIAIGLSKARRAGVKLPPPAPGKTSPRTRHKAEQDLKAAKDKPIDSKSKKRSDATKSTLEREDRSGASSKAMSRHGHEADAKRTHEDRSAAAKKAAKTRAANRAKGR